MKNNILNARPMYLIGTTNPMISNLFKAEIGKSLFTGREVKIGVMMYVTESGMVLDHSKRYQLFQMSKIQEWHVKNNTMLIRTRNNSYRFEA